MNKMCSVIDRQDTFPRDGKLVNMIIASNGHNFFITINCKF